MVEARSSFPLPKAQSTHSKTPLNPSSEEDQSDVVADRSIPALAKAQSTQSKTPLNPFSEEDRDDAVAGRSGLPLEKVPWALG